MSYSELHDDTVHIMLVRLPYKDREDPEGILFKTSTNNSGTLFGTSTGTAKLPYTEG